MKSKFDLSEGNIKDQLEENKELVIALSVLGAAIALFLFFILPNILSFQSKISDRQIEVEEFNRIKEAQAILEATDQQQLEKEVEVVSRTLPSDRDFVGVIGALSEAATKSNVQILSYKYADSQKTKKAKDDLDTSVKFDIEIIGGIEESARFSEEILKTYPISNIQEIAYEKGISELTIEFYYKVFTSVKAQDVSFAREKTQAEKEAYEEISEWSSFDFSDIFIQQISTASADLF